MHIRRTDQDLSIKESKTEYFVEKMKSLLETRKEVRFFLATDDEDEELMLQEIFGEKIITQKRKVFNRNSVEGMEAAIIDVLCLANCEFILGSFASVYSNFAAQYGNIDLYVPKETNENHNRWQRMYSSSKT